MQHSPVVNRFNKTGPKQLVNFKCGSNDFARESHGRELRQ